MPSRAKLDFDLLDSFEAAGPWISISSTLKEELQSLQETQERVEGCLRFCWHVAYEPASSNRDATEDTEYRQRYLRAALAEYASMEDAARWDCQASGREVPPKMTQLRDPRLHVVRLLRNTNIHLRASRLSQARRLAIWDCPDGPEEFEFQMFIVDNLEEEVRPTGKRKYEPDELDRMISWLEAEQREWGIPNVIHRAAETYAKILVRRC